VDKIKAEAQKELDDQKTAIDLRKKWQILSDDTSKWARQGASNAEIYVDENNCLVLKNPNPSGGPDNTLTNNNNGENWKDFILSIEFKVLSGSLDLILKSHDGGLIPFPRKFNDTDWKKYTIEVKGDKLTISGTGMNESKSATITSQAGPIIIYVKPSDNIIIKELKVKIIE
jgi:hypothetical protein